MNRTFRVCWLVLGLLACLASTLQAAENERRWDLLLHGFFKDGTKPLYLYARESQGQWIAVVGSSRDPDREGKKTYNRSWYYADLSGVPIKDGSMKGRFTLYVTPDLWVPLDHKPYTVEFEIDARLRTETTVEGSYKVVAIHSKDPTTQTLGKGGAVTGTARPFTQAELPGKVTFECNMQGSLVGGSPDFGDRCMVLWLGLEEGKLVSNVHGLLNKKFEGYAKTNFSVEGNSVRADRDRFTAHISAPTKTLDMEPCRYIFEIDGRRMDWVLVGAYRLTVQINGESDVVHEGSFDGKWYEGVTQIESDDRP